MTGPVERAWRAERAGIVAVLARRLGDLDVAEDAVQEAFAAAVVRWPIDGVPARPGAWLMTTAWRRALDAARRQRRWLPLDEGSAVAEEEPNRSFSDLHITDEMLGLLLACCHPALNTEARVALTLRHVAALTVGEIAAAFLISEAAMAKRLVRARAKIRDAGISFEVPDWERLPGRLADARAVIYLVFTEGHLASGDGPAVRTELCDEAVWLARQLHALVPDDLETTGLLALLLFLHARSPARLAADGRLLPIGAQDRSRWGTDAVVEARALLATTANGPLGPYQVEAAIAALHAAAPDPDGTRWDRIAELHGVLDRLAPSPVVTVNRAVAVGRADGPQAGLEVLAPALADDRLAGYAPLHAAHADLLERSGDLNAAQAAWMRAAERAPNPEQQAELRRRAAGVAG